MNKLFKNISKTRVIHKKVGVFIKSTLRLPGLKAVACLRPELRPRGSGLTLHFDKLNVLSLPKEAALLYPSFKGGVWRRRMGQVIGLFSFQVSN